MESARISDMIHEHSTESLDSFIGSHGLFMVNLQFWLDSRGGQNCASLLPKFAVSLSVRLLKNGESNSAKLLITRGVLEFRKFILGLLLPHSMVAEDACSFPLT